MIDGKIISLYNFSLKLGIVVSNVVYMVDYLTVIRDTLGCSVLQKFSNFDDALLFGVFIAIKKIVKKMATIK